MAIAGSTVPCVRVSVSPLGEPIIGASRRALKEVVCANAVDAYAAIVQGQIVYLEMRADNIESFREMVRSRQGTPRFK